MNRPEDAVGRGGGGDAGTGAGGAEIAHVSRSLMQATVPVLILVAATVVCGPVVAPFAGLVCLLWPVFVTIFHVLFRFRSNRLGAPMDMTQAVLALLAAAPALLLSGHAAPGLLVTGFALAFCGAAAGAWLAVLAARTGMTLRQSLAAVFGLKGRHRGRAAR